MRLFTLLAAAAPLIVAGWAAWLLFTKRRRGGAIGAGAAGAVYDMLNDQKRKAVEVIAEKRAEVRDPESKDGNLPDLDR